MTWQEIREKYPHRWLVVEAIGAYSVRIRRIIENLEVRGVFSDDWKETYEFYSRLHAEDIWREYYFLHTERKELNIEVMYSVSPRILVK